MTPSEEKPRSSAWTFAIDVGGTFTDCVARDPEGARHTFKLLSSGELRAASGGAVREAVSGEPAPLVAIRAMMGLGPGEDPGEIRIRLGTTRATNALLERRGARTALITNEGFADLLEIGNQDRPRLFDLNIRKREGLHEKTVGVPGRMNAEGAEIEPLDEEFARECLKELRESGITSAAVCLMHAWRNPAHELRLAELAREAGFEHVSVSSEVSPTIRIVPRADTTVVDASLTPVVRDYIEAIRKGAPRADLRLMTSSGGMTRAEKASGHNLILSGPAGGVVGYAKGARDAGFARAIGFDMGGTSTDVSRFGGEFAYEHETVKGGVRIVAPMLAIETVAAGGGSVCEFDGVMFGVGPRSAGADPGPACYGRGGPLTITDANLVLGRLSAGHFPFPLDADAARRRIAEIGERVFEATGRRMSEAEIAGGFVAIANARMAAAIRRVSVARGYDVRDHCLVSFGGAGAQHACAVAKELDIGTILIPPLAGILSAVGIEGADVSRFAVRSVLVSLDPAEARGLESAFVAMEESVLKELREEGAAEEEIRPAVRRMDLRYEGQVSAITVARPADGDWRGAFEREHELLFGHRFEGRGVEVVSIRVDQTAGSEDAECGARAGREDVPPATPEVVRNECVVFGGLEIPTPLFEAGALRPGDCFSGPALVVSGMSTAVVDPGWIARVSATGDLILTADGPGDPQEEAGKRGCEAPTPVLLELYNNMFASIATRMGETLRRTALSTNVKERLDFSCALFTAGGDLVANAPHVPVHLGAMSECVKRILADEDSLAPGDVIVTNDPMRGGSHIPDVTVVTPVHSPEGGKLLGFTASRAHHAEIGGIRPGSMPPDSRTLAEEGVLIRNFKVIDGGRERFTELREILTAGEWPSRAPDENIADVQAQIAANRQGARDLLERIAASGQGPVLAFMDHVRDAAEARTRACLRGIGDGVYRFEDSMDDGSVIRLAITIRGDEAEFDFSGTAPVSEGNLNANRAIVTAAVLYCLRCLIGEEIPLNGGVLAPVRIVLPVCMINPPGDEDPTRCPAVVGGNVETSQRIVDVILAALGAAAQSQGTMNNLTFGNSRFGYYETICGGAGAGPGFAGADAVHTHMTNTRMTDPEVLEARYPVRLRRFEIRRGSGGSGRFRGGDGVIREIEFLAPLEVSLLTQRRERPPQGLAGGGPGLAGLNLSRRRGAGRFAPLPGTVRYQAEAGDELRIETPGGGGYGAADSEGE